MKRLFTGLAIAILFFIPFYIFGAPTVSWDESTPDGTESKSLGDNRIREFKTQAREIVDVDHVWSSSGSGTTWGYHNVIHFIPTSDLGTGSSTAHLVGVDGDGTDTELTYNDDSDSSVRITYRGGLDATSLRGAIGGTTPAAGTFTTMTATTIVNSGTLDLATGPKVNEISTDGTIADNSDSELITAKAVKTYVNATVPSSPFTSYDSGWLPASGGLASGILLTCPHGLGAAPTRVEVYGKGSLVSGNANGGDPTIFPVSTGYNSGQNGTSINFDATNVYVAWTGGAAWIIDTGGTFRAVTNASSDLQFRVFAW